MVGPRAMMESGDVAGEVRGSVRNNLGIEHVGPREMRGVGSDSVNRDTCDTRGPARASLILHVG